MPSSSSSSSPVRTPTQEDDKDIKHKPLLLKAYNQTKLLSILTFFPIIGLLSRKALTTLTTYQNSYLSGIIWANFAACFIMGMVTHSADHLWTSSSSSSSSKKDVSLYIGITTGFCGTVSSFSSLILEVFTQSADIHIGNNNKYPNDGYAVMEFCSVIITQLCVSLGAFQVGKHIIHGFNNNKTVVLRSKQWNTLVHPMEKVIGLFGIMSWIAVVVLCITIEDWRSWTFACVVSPISCWTRYYLSKWLNPRFKHFPMGTFLVNVLACVILAILTLLNRGKGTTDTRLINTTLSCRMIQGLEDGYCGTLSTVSTFVMELYTLQTSSAYRYGTVSIGVCYVLILLILGSYNWTVGLIDPLCS